MLYEGFHLKIFFLLVGRISIRKNMTTTPHFTAYREKYQII